HYGDPAKRLWRAGSQLDARAPGRAAAAAAGGVPEPDADRQADFSLRNDMKITTTRSLLVAIIATGLALSGRTVTDGFLRAETIAQTPAPQVDEIAVALRNPGSHQRVGLPDFVWASGAPEMAEHARTVAEVLWADLDFEREFYMIRRTESARIPA